MPRLETEELVRKHVWLYAKDVERIDAMFGQTIGFSKAFRLIVRKFMDQAEAKAQHGAKSSIQSLNEGEIHV